MQNFCESCVHFDFTHSSVYLNRVIAIRFEVVRSVVHTQRKHTHDS